MAKVTVILPHFNPQLPAPAPVEHKDASEFAWVAHEAGHVLEVYNADHGMIATYAPGCWASAALG